MNLINFFLFGAAISSLFYLAFFLSEGRSYPLQDKIISFLLMVAVWPLMAALVLTIVVAYLVDDRRPLD